MHQLKEDRSHGTCVATHDEIKYTAPIFSVAFSTAAFYSFAFMITPCL